MKFLRQIGHNVQPNTVLILGLLLAYSLLVVYTRSVCWRDPTSKFFRPLRAHAPNYSAHRIQQAIRYADVVANEDEGTGSRDNPPELCIGVPSVQRSGISYLKATLGSLQHGLTPKERARLHFVVLLAHTDQQTHPDYGQAWLINMADKLPSYHDDPERLELAKKMEEKKTHETKSKFDYSIVMDECRKTGAPYMLLVEDDVVFLDGWRHRTMRALGMATTESWEAARTDFLYLRLFYYEGLRGWNVEAWQKYTGWSVTIVSGVLGTLLLTRRFIPSSRRHLTRSAVLLVVFAFTPLLILLYFAAGANCVQPEPAGVSLMPDHACCGQALVFPHATVTNDLLPHFEKNRWNESPTDSFIEDHADATGGLRWALTPVVMQHVGSMSSHELNRGPLGNMTPSDIWNFQFETNDAGNLAAEHTRLNGPAVQTKAFS